MKIIILLSFYLSISQLRADLETKELSRDFIRIERQAQNSSGFYYGLKEQDKFKRYQIKSCQFLYEKGLGEHPQDNREFAYERFMVSFSGVDKKGVSSFDSVLYGHSDFSSQFKRLDFSKSFSFRPFKRVESNSKDNLGQVKALRKSDGELLLTFQHQEVFDSSKSSFFEKGEQRDYMVEVHFSQFTDKVVNLKKVSVETYKSINGEGRRKIVDVTCDQFKTPES